MAIPSIASSEALLSAAQRFGRASFSRSQAIIDGELSRAEWQLMWILKHWPDPMGARPSELARKQRVTAGNVAQQLRQLEQQSLVVRKQDSDDKRVVMVKLTPRGETKLQQVRNEFVKQFEKLIEHLGAEESRQLIRLLLTAADFLEQAETAT